MIIDIKNSYIGDASVSRMYQGDQLVWDSNHPDILLEYISNGASSTTPNVFFSTGVPGSLTNKVEIKYSYHTQMDGTVLFGVGTSSNATYYYVPLYANTPLLPGSTVKFWCRNVDGYSSVVPTVDTPHVLTTYSTYTSSSAATAVNVILDGQLTSRSYTISSSITGTGNMYMFAKHNAEDSTQAASMFAPADTRIYYMKIWVDNRLARFFIPVLHYINGQYTPCFYDKVTNNYEYNLGTEDVTYKIQGDVVLDYINNSTTNDTPDVYYNTGVLPTLMTKTDIKYSIGELKVNRALFGTTDAESNSTAASRYYMLTYAGLDGISPTVISNKFYYNYATIGYEAGSPEVNSPHVLSMCGIYSSVSSASSLVFYYDGNKYTKSATISSISTSYPIYLLAQNAANTAVRKAWKNTKVYYYVLTEDNSPARTYVPVLHNSQPAFLDLNSNTYMYNLGTDTPYYQFK